MKYIFIIIGFMILPGMTIAQIDQSQSAYVDPDYTSEIQEAEKIIQKKFQVFLLR